MVPTAFMLIMYDGINSACKTLHNSAEAQLTGNNSVTRDKMTVQASLNHLLAKVNSGVLTAFLTIKIENFLYFYPFEFYSFSPSDLSLG